MLLLERQRLIQSSCNRVTLELINELDLEWVPNRPVSSSTFTVE